MKQELKQKTWVDEAGREVPTMYLNGSDKLKERHAHTLLIRAKSLNEKLREFKELSRRLNDEVFTKSMEDLRAKGDGKGNYTWFNFNRSVKIEVSVNERIEFDDLTIKACKEKLDEFLNVSVESKHDFVKQLVTDAFATTRGKLDAKKVMSLLRYEDKIKDALFQESLALLKQSIRRPDSRTYYRISERQEDGSYQVIDLNFSSIL
ncbi:MAG: DUF3164 family protein [Prevotellaceae bacterium]|nr:DUF3164 family protein [Prevotellaceae bacterium]